MLQEAGHDDLDADTATIRCLAHVIHLAVMDLLVGLKAMKKTDVHKEEIDLLPLTEDLAEAIAGDFDEGEKTDDEIVEEQRNQDGNEVLASMIGHVRHYVTMSLFYVATSSHWHSLFSSSAACARCPDRAPSTWRASLSASNSRILARKPEQRRKRSRSYLWPFMSSLLTV